MRREQQFRSIKAHLSNHPLWSFPNGQNLSLGLGPAIGRVNTPLFGTTTSKQGHRVVQAAV